MGEGGAERSPDDPSISGADAAAGAPGVAVTGAAGCAAGAAKAEVEEGGGRRRKGTRYSLKRRSSLRRAPVTLVQCISSCGNRSSTYLKGCKIVCVGVVARPRVCCTGSERQVFYTRKGGIGDRAYKPTTTASERAFLSRLLKHSLHGRGHATPTHAVTANMLYMMGRGDVEAVVPTAKKNNKHQNCFCHSTPDNLITKIID